MSGFTDWKDKLKREREEKDGKIGEELTAGSAGKSEGVSDSGLHGRRVHEDRDDYPGETFDTGFMREEIKKHPLNRRKMIKRMSWIAVMAALFGTVACLFFLLLEPVFNKVLYPEETPAAGVTYPEETAAEELTPEEMRENDEEKEASEEQEKIRQEVESVLQEQNAQGISVGEISESLQQIARGAAPFLADISGISSDTDWFNDTYESTDTQVSGFIIALNAREAQVLVCAPGIGQAQKIEASLYGGITANASVRAADRVTGIAVLTVDLSGVDSDAVQKLQAAELGTSSQSVLTGKIVIAAGRPTGDENSIAYGTAESVSNGMNLADSSYRQITTSIYGSSSASGVLIDLDGRVVGLIDMSHRRADMPNTLCAIGISELKDLIEKLSAGTQKAYLGIQCTDVPESVRKSQNIPEGIYVSEVEDNSPAMNAGVQNGDILTEIGDTQIRTCKGLADALLDAQAGDSVRLQLQRLNGDGYSEMDLTANLE